MRIVFLGPPGAGKGTQSKVVAQRLKFPHISTGDILRQNVTDGTALGKEAKSYMDKGALVPDALVTEMLSSRLNQADTQHGFILDGYPRNIKQAETLESILQRNSRKLDMVLYLDTSDHIIVKRLTGRRVCKNCGSNYHVVNMPPKRENSCDNCSGELYQRTDDNEETIKTRLEVYKKEVSSLLEYYARQKILYKVPSDDAADTVLDRIIKEIEQFHDTAKK